MNQADEPKIIFIEKDQVRYFADKSDFNKPCIDRPEFEGEALTA